jgi:hypothetical protein
VSECVCVPVTVQIVRYGDPLGDWAWPVARSRDACVFRGVIGCNTGSLLPEMSLAVTRVPVTAAIAHTGNLLAALS